jgi:hypothetical protein
MHCEWDTDLIGVKVEIRINVRLFSKLTIQITFHKFNRPWRHLMRHFPCLRIKQETLLEVISKIDLLIR